MKFSAQQQEAIDKIVQWWNDGNPARQVFVLKGFAGTGKTTVIKHVPEILGVSAQFAAFTGKAVNVLRSKGCDPVGTLHSLVYKPCPVDNFEEIENQEQLVKELTARGDRVPAELLVKAKEKLRWLKKDHGTVDFSIREESKIQQVDLLIVDEVSMVGDELANDLLAFDTPVLVLGDPEQLPPVQGEGKLVRRPADAMLEEIHRQASGSPVIQLATKVREAPIGARNFGVPTSHINSSVGRAEYQFYDQVLVGTNKTRWRVIRDARAVDGKPEGVPVVGDRIMMLINDREKGVFNGQQFDVLNVPEPRRETKYVRHERKYHELTYYDLYVQECGTDDKRFVEVLGEPFAGPQQGAKRGSPEADPEGWAKKARVGLVATFADAITVHKAQGSEWDNVLVVNEADTMAFMAKAGGKDPKESFLAGRRWLYTGITRAAKSVEIVSRLR